ncbi:MAG: hypothetical protein ACFB2X_01815 [Rivularia sp. (in: cyanobacteria)]
MDYYVELKFDPNLINVDEISSEAEFSGGKLVEGYEENYSEYLAKVQFNDQYSANDFLRSCRERYRFADLKGMVKRDW